MPWKGRGVFLLERSGSKKGGIFAAVQTYADHMCKYPPPPMTGIMVEPDVVRSTSGRVGEVTVTRNSVVIIKLGAVGMIAGTIGVATDAVRVAAELRAVSNSNCHWTVNHVSYHVIFIKENVPIKRMYPNVFKATIMCSVMRRPCLPLQIALQPVIL